MRLHGKQYVGGLAVLLFSLPVWGRTLTAHVYVDNPTTVGSTTLKPGEYNVKVDEGQKTAHLVKSDGKPAADVPVEWVQLPAKASTTQVVTVQDGKTTKIVEVDFGGTTEGLRFD